MNDADGNDIIVVLSFDKKQQEREKNVYEIVTLYGMDTSRTTLESWLANEIGSKQTLAYIHKTKSAEWMTVASNHVEQADRTRFEAVEAMIQNSASDEYIISTEADLDKLRAENPANYQSGGERVTRGMFQRDPGSGGIVTIFKARNRSTFIHEIAHSFLEDLIAISAIPGASAQIRADFETVREWLGMGDEQTRPTREQHEKFADGFLNYLYKEQAPAKNLRGVFTRFRGWLRELFETGEIANIEMSDEVRGALLSFGPTFGLGGARNVFRQVRSKTAGFVNNAAGGRDIQLDVNAIAELERKIAEGADAGKPLGDAEAGFVFVPKDDLRHRPGSLRERRAGGRDSYSGGEIRRQSRRE
jgi:hypothetical protein